MKKRGEKEADGRHGLAWMKRERESDMERERERDYL